MVFAHRSIVPAVLLLRRHSNRSIMNDEKDKRETQTRSAAKNPNMDPRKDRLKLALRENLKRRKSQARGRSDKTSASSDEAGVSLDDHGGKKPGE